MSKILCRYGSAALLLCLCCIVFYNATAQQESVNGVYRTYRPRDTAVVFALVRQGAALVDNQPERALPYFNQALQFSRNTGFGDGVGYTLAYMGIAATNLGNFDQAFAYYKEALPYCLQAKYIKGALPVLYVHMSSTWHNKGDDKQAIAYLYKTLIFLQQNLPDDKNLMVVHNNLSSLQLKLGQYRDALAHANIAMVLAGRKQNFNVLALAILNKGNSYAALQLPDSAMQYYHKGLALVQAMGYTDMQSIFYNSMGDLMLNEHREQEAMQYYRHAMQYNNTAHNMYSTNLPQYSLGMVLYRLKNYKEAEPMLQDALKKLGNSNLVENQKSIHATLSALYEASGRYREALQEQRLYDQLNDSKAIIEMSHSINSIETKYYTAQKDKEIAEKKLTIAQKDKNLARKSLLINSIVATILLLVLLGGGLYAYKQKIDNRDRKIEQLKAMISGEEKERTRISRELHDGIGGMLTGIKMNLKAVQKRVHTQPQDLDEIMAMLQDMGHEIHKTAHNLMPDILLQHSLSEALQLYFDQLDTGGKLQIGLQFHGDLSGFDKSLELSLYRMVQELVQNIMKHAQASMAAIQLSVQDDILRISVEDNGQGFEPRTSSMGLGLKNIEARVQILNGFFSTESAPGMGTTNYIEIDLKKYKGPQA